MHERIFLTQITADAHSKGKDALLAHESDANLRPPRDSAEGDKVIRSGAEIIVQDVLPLLPKGLEKLTLSISSLENGRQILRAKLEEMENRKRTFREDLFAFGRHVADSLTALAGGNFAEMSLLESGPAEHLRAQIKNIDLEWKAKISERLSKVIPVAQPIDAILGTYCSLSEKLGRMCKHADDLLGVDVSRVKTQRLAFPAIAAFVKEWTNYAAMLNQTISNHTLKTELTVGLDRHVTYGELSAVANSAGTGEECLKNIPSIKRGITAIDHDLRLVKKRCDDEIAARVGLIANYQLRESGAAAGDAR